MKNLQIKTFEFKVDEADDSENEGRIKGFASTFGNVDLGNDVVKQGAFAKTLKEGGANVPILNHHDPRDQIGWNEKAEETKKGLVVEGIIDLNVQTGKEKYSLAKKAMKLGAKMGFSIGYAPIKYDIDKTNGVRSLNEVKLWEYSIVTFGMNPKALVTAAKSWKSEEENAGVKEHLASFIISMQAQGYNDSEVKDALQWCLTKGAASQVDPSGIAQSLDELIEKMRS